MTEYISSSEAELSTNIVDHVEADDLMDKAVRTDVKGQEIQDKGQVRRDGMWDVEAVSDPDRSVAHSGRHGETLEQQERREAEEAEMAHQRERAINTFGEEEADRRAEECREACRAQSELNGRSTVVDARTNPGARESKPGLADNRVGSRMARTASERLERAMSFRDIGLARPAGDRNKAATDTIKRRLGVMSRALYVPQVEGCVDSWLPPMGRWDAETERDPIMPEDTDDLGLWGLEKGTLDDVLKAGEQLAETFEGEPTNVEDAQEFAEIVGRRVQNGSDVLTALLGVQEWFKKTVPGVRQDIDNIAPYEQGRATVEVEVVKLWEPKSAKQRQCGLVSDGSCEPIKFTQWQKSGADKMVREGDVIRVEQAAVNGWNGKPTLAMTGETSIQHIERGSGEMNYRAQGGSQPTPPTWSADSSEHAWVNALDSEQAVEATKRSMNIEYPREDTTYEQLDGY